MKMMIYGFKYSYLIQIIFTQLPDMSNFQTNLFDLLITPTSKPATGVSGPGSDDNERVTPHTQQEPQHRMQFSIISRITLGVSLNTL